MLYRTLLPPPNHSPHRSRRLTRPRSLETHTYIYIYFIGFGANNNNIIHVYNGRNRPVDIVTRRVLYYRAAAATTIAGGLYTEVHIGIRAVTCVDNNYNIVYSSRFRVVVSLKCRRRIVVEHSAKTVAPARNH